MGKVWTGQIHRLKGKEYLDITVKSGDTVFAPTWKMVIALKKGRITEEEYRKKYEEKMRNSYREYTDRWEEVLYEEELVLACYCKPGTFCHRILLAGILSKCGAEYMGEV